MNASNGREKKSAPRLTFNHGLISVRPHKKIELVKVYR